jgi:uncharacterized protein YacL
MRLKTVIILIGVGLIFYLSWVSNPDLVHVWFIPKWLAKWTDTRSHQNIRTAVPFVFLGLIIELFDAPKSLSKYRLLLSWLALVGVVIIAELGQLLRPYRTFSWSDIGWGAIGAFVGLVIARLLAYILRKFRS